MDPTESRTKRRKTAVADVDRISQLPDDLLILVLSSLSTKEAFKTSLLAKNFENRWATLPDVNLDFDEFLPDDDTFDDLGDSKDEKKLLKLHAEKFKKFGDRILNNPDKLRNLKKLNLAWVEEKTDPSPASKWLDTVAKQNLKFLSVRISSKSDFRVPDSIFSSKSLEEMELNLENEIIAPPQESVHLPHLKKLTLHSIFIEDGVMQKLSGLPALEEMVVFDCYLRTCEISSDTLKRLELNGYYNFNDEAGVNETDITISTPHLLYLELLSCAKGTIKLNKMKYPVKACIHYSGNSLFLTGLSNAFELELMLAKSSVLEETTKFPNLKTLKIGEWCMTDEFDVVDHFLSHARNLQKLTLLHCRQERNKESLFNFINLLERSRKIWTINLLLTSCNYGPDLSFWNSSMKLIPTIQLEWMNIWIARKDAVLSPSGDEIQMEINLEFVGNNVNILDSKDKENDDITELVNRVSIALLLLG